MWDEVIRSAVHLWWRPFPYHLRPFFFLRVHTFALPLYFGLIPAGGRADFLYFLLIGTDVGESRVASEPILDLFLFLLFFHDGLEGVVRTVDRGIGSGRGQLGFPLGHSFVDLFVTFGPEFPISYTFLQMLNLIMGTIEPRSWHYFT